MNISFIESDKETLFSYETYDEFTKERLKLNYEHTLKLWYSLPEGLPTRNDGPLQRHTRRQQRLAFRKIKIFYLYSKIFKRSCLKRKIYSTGIRLCNDTFDVPATENEAFYEIYQSLVRVTVDFMNKGKRYDPSINFDELFKAGRLLWTTIAIQAQFSLPLQMSDSIFGYNMLYPYTDDFVDCPSVSQAAKKEFALIFHHRLRIGESTYDPNAHFNGQQSNTDELQLSPLLKPYADKIGKTFDMVKLIENDWQRRGEHECVYMSLATIHDAQIKSTLQHARPDDNYSPTMAQIEQVSADKGGASLIATGFLIEGKLTRAKLAYLEYLGFGMQLVDDLQDVELDMKNNHRTIFTQSIAEGKTLDAPTARLIQYCYAASAYEKFALTDSAFSNTENGGVSLPRYAYILMVKGCVILILEAASRLRQYYSREFFRELSSLSPLPFNALKKIAIEDKLMAIVRNNWF